MKTYVLIVSRVFPATHPRKGQPTLFIDKIYCGQKLLGICDGCEHRDCGHCDIALSPKLHTIRANYALWVKRIEEVQAGRAELVLRYWVGQPYRSKQQEFLRLGKDDGVGIQKIEFSASGLMGMIKIDDGFPDGEYGGYQISELSKNDGLLLQDFEDWFKGHDLSKPMAIIHFTKFRY